jgi:phenylpropionate dioxygenase-like ring-hydroxylating dioxygenase large terminal subunit
MAKLNENYKDLGWGELLSKLQADPAEPLVPTSGVALARRELLVEIAQRHIELIKLDRTDEAEHMMEVDTRQYLDPEIFAREKAAIFDRMPVIAGLSQDVAKPGDYLKFSDLDVPVFITRNKEGQVKAFLNGCRHRGTEMINNDRGGGKPLFTCPYHGWSYDLNGALVGVPCGHAFDKLDKKDFGLTEIACEERHGIIFVAPKPGVPLDLDRYINPELGRELDLWEAGTMRHVYTGPIHIDGNWKLTLDSFNESYHFAVGHAKNLALISNVNVNTFDAYDDHVRITISRSALQEDMKHTPFEKNPALLNYFTIAYSLFPCYVLIPGANMLTVFRLFPKSVNETLIQYSTYSSLPLDVEGNREALMQGWQQAHDIILTDDLPYAVIGASRTIRAGAMPKIVFGKNEQALQAIQNSIRAAVAEYEK